MLGDINAESTSNCTSHTHIEDLGDSRSLTHHTLGFAVPIQLQFAYSRHSARKLGKFNSLHPQFRGVGLSAHRLSTSKLSEARRTRYAAPSLSCFLDTLTRLTLLRKVKRSKWSKLSTTSSTITEIGGVRDCTRR